MQFVQSFYDLSKSFDNVDIDVLLRKMECYGVRGNMHLLVSSYLVERKKRSLAFEGMNQPVKISEVWVQQGSLIGPLLFLIHINDLDNYTSLSVLNFADDTMLYRTFAKNTYLNDSKCLSTELKWYQVGLWETK